MIVLFIPFFGRFFLNSQKSYFFYAFCK